jgi:GNAT superfamily N-acetyltransferase
MSPGDPAPVSSPSRPLPSPREAWLYLRNNGLARSLGKFLATYVAGRQSWYMTSEDLRRYLDWPPPAGSEEFRFATAADLARMNAFTGRMTPAILAEWCGPGYFFFVTLIDGQPVSYRCLSTLVHPGVEGFVRLRPDQIFMVDEFTAPPFRRRGITRRMAAAMAPTLVARGFREVVGIHRVDNDDTIAAAEAKGIPRVGTVTRWCVPWHVWFTFEAAPARPTSVPIAILDVPVTTTGPAPLTEPASTV